MLRLGSVALGCALLITNAHPARAAPCVPDQCKQFDFFVGNWLVRDHLRRIVATDIVSKNDYCTLIEQWSGAAGSGEGLAAMTYQRAEKTWRRDALLRSSAVLGFEGRIAGGSMIMTAKQYSESGIVRLHRIRWSPKSDGSVEELWQTSTDAGRSWQVRFDDMFTRIAE